MLSAALRYSLSHIYRRFVPLPSPVQHIEVGTFDGYEIAYRKGSVDENVLRESFTDDIYFSGVPQYIPGEDHVVIDVGAHIGTFALLASRKVPLGRVFAIEASRETYNLLHINVALNGLKNLIDIHAAVADHQGTVTLNHSSANWGHTIVTSRGGNQSEEVPSLTLENLLEKYNISRCNFLKMNCEGAEFPILLSSPIRTLRKFGVILALYHCDLYTGPATESDLAAHLRSAGFQTTFSHQSTNRGWLIAHSNEIKNELTGSSGQLL